MITILLYKLNFQFLLMNNEDKLEEKVNKFFDFGVQIQILAIIFTFCCRTKPNKSMLKITF